jgi:hypothetical protein
VYAYTLQLQEELHDREWGSCAMRSEEAAFSVLGLSC